MDLRHLTTRTAATGITAALAAGALVGLGTSAAHAETASNVYTCTYAPLAVTFDTTVTATGELPVPQYWAGAPIPAGLLNVTVTASDIPAAMVQYAGVSSATADAFAFDMGSGSVPVPLSGAVNAGTRTWTATGSNTAFTTPTPGVASATLPGQFLLTATGTGGTSYPLDCVLKAGTTPSTMVSINLLRQKSALTVKKSVKVKQGKKATIKVKAQSTSLLEPVTSGKVVAKKGKKVVGKATINKKGVAKIKLRKKFKPGKHKIKLSYAGTSSIKGSSAKTFVIVAQK